MKRPRPIRLLSPRALRRIASGFAIVLCSGLACGQARVLEVLADGDSRYKIAGESKPSITVNAGEPIVLRVTARKAKSWNRDGSIHGFTLLRASDRSKVPGWDLLLKPGVQEFLMTVPAQPGEYVVVCTVVCSEDHEGMHMKFTVLPSKGVGYETEPNVDRGLDGAAGRIVRRGR